jgi:hypothetical protein
LTLHGLLELHLVEYIARDDRDGLRVGIAQTLGPPQIERRGNLARGEENPCRVAGQLSVRPQDQNFDRHGSL